MAIDTMKKGQGDWQKIFNALIALANIGGGTVNHLDEPLQWENGATGHSNAYTIQLLNGYKLVLLSVTHFNASELSNNTDVAAIPDNLAPANNDNFIRMALSQYRVLANTGGTRLTIWTADGPTKTDDMYGTAIYVAKA